MRRVEGILLRCSLRSSSPRLRLLPPPRIATRELQATENLRPKVACSPEWLEGTAALRFGCSTEDASNTKEFTMRSVPLLVGLSLALAGPALAQSSSTSSANQNVAQSSSAAVNVQQQVKEKSFQGRLYRHQGHAEVVFGQGQGSEWQCDNDGNQPQLGHRCYRVQDQRQRKRSQFNDQNSKPA